MCAARRTPCTLILCEMTRKSKASAPTFLGESDNENSPQSADSERRTREGLQGLNISISQYLIVLQRNDSTGNRALITDY